MERQNVTLSLPKELLKKAKVIAASKDKSLSEFLRESLEKRIKEDVRYKKAVGRQIKLLSQGYDLSTKGQIKFMREELHFNSKNLSFVHHNRRLGINTQPFNDF